MDRAWGRSGEGPEHRSLSQQNSYIAEGIFQTLGAKISKHFDQVRFHNRLLNGVLYATV